MKALRTLFPFLRAMMELTKVVRSLEQTIIARTVLDYPQLQTIPLEAHYTRKNIYSPLLKWLYDRRATRAWQEELHEEAYERRSTL